MPQIGDEITVVWPNILALVDRANGARPRQSVGMSVSLCADAEEGERSVCVAGVVA